MNTVVVIMLAIGLAIALTSLSIGLVIAIQGYRECREIVHVAGR